MKTLCKSMDCWFREYTNPDNDKNKHCIDCWSTIPDYIPREQYRKYLRIQHEKM